MSEDEQFSAETVNGFNADVSLIYHDIYRTDKVSITS